MKYVKNIAIAICVVNTILAIFDGRIQSFFNL